MRAPCKRHDRGVLGRRILVPASKGVRLGYRQLPFADGMNFNYMHVFAC